MLVRQIRMAKTMKHNNPQMTQMFFVIQAIIMHKTAGKPSQT